jgi:hypothetical protein
MIDPSSSSRGRTVERTVKDIADPELELIVSQADDHLDDLRRFLRRLWRNRAAPTETITQFFPIVPSRSVR